MGRACPVCRCVSPAPLQPVRYALFDDSSLPRATVVARCAQCGFVFADSEAAEDDYLRHYRVGSVYAAPQVRAGSGERPEDVARLAAACTRFADRLPADALFVDIGAGSGGLLQQVRAATGCRVLGIDPDDACVQALRSRGLDAARGEIAADLARTYAGQARVVALSHVLEHLWQPREALAIALRMLAPGGAVYVETPDRDGYAECPNVPNYYFDPEHINHFAVADLGRLAIACGAHARASGRGRIALAAGISYPVCWAVIENGAAPAGTDIPETDAGAFDTFLSLQREAASQWRDAVRHRLAGVSPPFIVWGAGSQTQRVLAQDVLPRGAIACIVDADPSKQGRRLDGIDVLAPDSGLAAHAQAPVLVLAAAAAAKAIQADIARRWPGRRAIDLSLGTQPARALHA